MLITLLQKQTIQNDDLSLINLINDSVTLQTDQVTTIVSQYPELKDVPMEVILGVGMYQNADCAGGCG